MVETQLETLQGNYEQDFRIWEQKEPWSALTRVESVHESGPTITIEQNIPVRYSNRPVKLPAAKYSKEFAKIKQQATLVKKTGFEDFK